MAKPHTVVRVLRDIFVAIAGVTLFVTATALNLALLGVVVVLSVVSLLFILHLLR
jgi:hypothetical protein